MGWLLGPTLMGIVASFIIVKVFDYMFAGATGGLVSIARVSLFVGTWTAVTVRAGMHGFSKKVRQLRQGHKKATGTLAKLREMYSER